MMLKVTKRFMDGKKLVGYYRNETNLVHYENGINGVATEVILDESKQEIKIRFQDELIQVFFEEVYGKFSSPLEGINMLDSLLQVEFQVSEEL